MTEIKTEELTIAHKLSYIQSVIKAPKDQKNGYQGWGYRRAEDILESLKEHMPAGAYVLLSDDIWMVGERYYLKATASFCYLSDKISVTAYAREPFDEKGKQLPQITASCATYARKNALCALFAIDGSEPEDSQSYGEVDSRDNRTRGKNEAVKPKSLLSPEQLFELDNLIKSTNSESAKLLSHYKVEQFSDMNLEAYNHLIKGLKDRYAKMCAQV